jgi:hypothetical protein
MTLGYFPQVKNTVINFKNNSSQNVTLHTPLNIYIQNTTDRNVHRHDKGGHLQCAL